MFKPKSAFSGFSVSDLAAAKRFYSETLGLKVEDDGVGVRLHLPAGGTVFAYPKRDHQPATFTILNLVVDDIDASVDELTRRGVQFERYGFPGQDDAGIWTAPSGDKVAWFKDPDGNTLSLSQHV